MVVRLLACRPDSLARFETISHPGLRQNVFGRAGVGLEFLAQLSHEDPKVLVLLNAIAPPHCVENCTVREYFVGMLGHENQHIELLGSEPHLFSRHRNRMGIEVNAEVSPFDQRLSFIADRR